MSTSKLTHSGNILLAGFGGMIIMMSVLVYLSMKEDVTMVSKNYYEQELVYQNKLDAAGNANKYPEDFTAKVSGEEVALNVPPTLSANITNGTVEFYCPSSDKWDKKYPIASAANGVYTFRTSALEGPAYLVKLSFSVDGKDYYKQWKYSHANGISE